MADIFISYASEDRSRVEPLAKALEDQGWTVWWDPEIPPGKTFFGVIKEALEAAKCVVVLWSNQSIDSEWVIEEANNGKLRGILVPAKIDAVDPPLGFGLIQAADLTDWETETGHAGMVSLLNAISEFAGPPLQREESEQVVESPESSLEQQLEVQPEKEETTQPASTQTEHAKANPNVPKPDSTATTEPKFSEPRKTSNAVKFGAVAGAIVLLIVGAWWWFSQQQVKVAEPISPKKAITNSIGMKFVLIPAGKFVMGSPPQEPGRDDDEKQHEVRISKPFYLQTTEVSQQQWKKVMGHNPSNFKNCGDDCPVEQVSWDDAQKFISKFNQMEDTNKYRLPTEAEWEYACRARTETAYPFGDEVDKLGEYAWYLANSGSQTHPVGKKKPNAWGLYDMHGNVWEWCQDWYSDYASNSVVDPKGSDNGEYRVLRGGSWFINAGSIRSANRSRYGPAIRSFNFGFRVARDF